VDRYPGADSDAAGQRWPGGAIAKDKGPATQRLRGLQYQVAGGSNPRPYDYEWCEAASGGAKPRAVAHFSAFERLPAPPRASNYGTVFGVSHEAEKIRNLLEGWFSHYPAHLRRRLRSRIIAGEFDSVFHELLLHKVVQRLGSTAVPHPGEAGRLPDFRVDRKGILSCFLEAAVATDVSSEEVLRRRLLNQFFDGANQLKPNGFFVDIERLVLRSGHQPVAKAVRRFLREKLDRLDPDRPLDDPRGSRLRCQDDDVEIDFRPVALLPDRRGDPSLYILGGPPSKSRWGGMAGWRARTWWRPTRPANGELAGRTGDHPIVQ
jgi:hypothetical protein